MPDIRQDGPVNDQRPDPPQNMGHGCHDCANYHVCTIRLKPPPMEVMERGGAWEPGPQPWPKYVTMPMPCGGSAWEQGDEIRTPGHKRKPDNMTWREFLAKEKGEQKGPAGPRRELP